MIDEDPMLCTPPLRSDDELAGTLDAFRMAIVVLAMFTAKDALGAGLEAVESARSGIVDDDHDPRVQALLAELGRIKALVQDTVPPTTAQVN